ncbi:hypothetical protein AB4090_04895 [Acidithiobacillus sp. IBUN Pt1247-S3]|uniref:hypothetical protein n=1 Tax=Acidithiobacillus sp. IBUN Pt1247-S3 TaxID=3166642 RepID=UPI0034E408FB
MIPKEKASEIVEHLQEALRVGIDEFSLRRMENEARTLLDIDQIMSRVALGLASALRKDEAGVHHHFQLAVSASSGEASILGMWCGALQYLGAFAEAHAIIQNQVKKHPENAGIAFIAMQLAIRLTRIREAVQYLALAQKSGLDNRDITIVQRLVDNGVIKKLDKIHVTDEQLQCATVVFLETLINFRLMPDLISIEASDDPDDVSLPILTYRITMAGGPETIADAICDTIVKLNSEPEIREDIFSVIMYTVEHVNHA